MTVSIALLTALAVSIFAGATNTNLATNSNIIIILLIALIALAGITSLNSYQCQNRIISNTGITQTLF